MPGRGGAHRPGLIASAQPLGQNLTAGWHDRGVSYDLQEYAPSALRGDALRELVAADQKLAVGEYDESRGWYSVVRGARGGYCFTVDGPVRVEAEDVPDEVTAAVLGVTHLFEITVEGSAAADIPHAVRFARRLAQTLGGGVVDQQTAGVWAKGAERQAVKPDRGQRVSVIRLEWYCRRESIGSDVGSRYLAICRRLLPEALPRRYGEYEPLQEKLDVSGDEGFAQAWRDATMLLSFTAASPCLSGSIGAGPNDERPGPVWHMSLDFHYQPLADDPRWREAVRRLFVAVAEEFGAFYASAEVTRGNIWNGRSMWSDGTTEWSITPARRDGWMGLPPYPVWWAWYGGPYQALVDGRLVGGVVTDHPSGLHHLLAEEPADRDELTRRVTRRVCLRRVAEWAPSELVAVIEPNERRVLPAPLSRAPHVPAELG